MPKRVRESKISKIFVKTKYYEYFIVHQRIRLNELMLLNMDSYR